MKYNRRRRISAKQGALTLPCGSLTGQKGNGRAFLVSVSDSIEMHC